uniref:Uncharacterized protein n=1 Tax=viral metagenome TaxID=1070528 RepID=A0A6M3IQH7_9ZZZZ
MSSKTNIKYVIEDEKGKVIEEFINWRTTTDTLAKLKKEGTGNYKIRKVFKD